MHVITAHGVNDALPHGLVHLCNYGLEMSSRNGPVLVAPTPVTTVYEDPRARVLFNPIRDANPFFHLMEALWMLDGRHDVEWLAYFNTRMASFSDDGVTFNGAYGYRWLEHFGYDQLSRVIVELTKDPTTRRVVLSMWDGHRDLGSTSKDIPCNTHIYFSGVTGKLDMTVLNRSNDIWWGCYGANMVHMSILHEVIAALSRIPLGVYRQVSNNFHLYTEVVTDEVVRHTLSMAPHTDFYNTGGFPEPLPIIQGEVGWHWFDDLRAFIEDPFCPTNIRREDPFFTTIARPMARAYNDRKTKVGDGTRHLMEMPICDWSVAASQWIARREFKGGE